MGLHEVEFGVGVGGDALEEVVCAGDDFAVPGWRGLGEDLVEGCGGAELVVVAGDEEFRLGALGEEVPGVAAAGGLDGCAEGDEAGDSRIAAGGAKADVGAEGEAGEEDGSAVLAGEPVERGTDVVYLADAVGVGAFGEAGAAEVEAQDGDAEAGEGLHRVVDDLVVHGAAEERVGMGDEGGVGAVAGSGVEEGFEASGGAVEVGEGAEHWFEDSCRRPARGRVSAPLGRVRGAGAGDADSSASLRNDYKNEDALGCLEPVGLPLVDTDVQGDQRELHAKRR